MDHVGSSTKLFGTESPQVCTEFEALHDRFGLKLHAFISIITASRYGSRLLQDHTPIIVVNRWRDEGRSRYLCIDNGRQLERDRLVRFTGYTRQKSQCTSHYHSAPPHARWACTTSVAVATRETKREGGLSYNRNF